jgi:hypothetical protein
MREYAARPPSWPIRLLAVLAVVGHGFGGSNRALISYLLDM